MKWMRETTPRWAGPVLLVAAAYNMAWGAFVVLFPSAPFGWIGLEPPRYPAIWQCVGMIVGVYGVGYAVAARDPLRHWPIVLVGLLGKVFGPIGFLWAAGTGQLPWVAGWTILTNDLIWWVPFAAILWQAARAVDAPGGEAPSLDVVVHDMNSHRGLTLVALSAERPLMVVFLRHAGCTFCREALADLQARRTEIERRGIGLALVHMGRDAEAEVFFSKYGLGDADRFADPERRIYRAFELERGSFRQLFGLHVWVRGFVAGVLNGHGVGPLAGDGFQMPGSFVLREGKIIAAHRPGSAADRADFDALAGACSIGPAQP